MLRRGKGLLVVEEPEAQLHPELQRIIAWLLLYLSGKGISVIATTHSDFIAVESRIAYRAARIGVEAVERILSELLGMKLSHEVVSEISKAISRAKLIPIYFSKGSFRELTLSEFEEQVPGIMPVASSQLRTMELLGELEEKKQMKKG